MFVLGQKCSKIDKNKWIPHTVPFKKVFIGPRSCMWTLSRLISTILIYLKWHQKWCIITKKGAISRWVKKKDHQKKHKITIIAKKRSKWLKTPQNCSFKGFLRLPRPKSGQCSDLLSHPLKKGIILSLLHFYCRLRTCS
jgi:hypothetical protein